jgi:endonuclease/exonuclease/phosphatase (EEP) superfamily protein YafD
VIDVMVWLLVAVLLAWTVIRLGGLDRGFPLVQVVAFTPYAALVALVVAGAAVATGRWGAAVAGGAAAVALAAVVVPRAVPRRRPVGAGSRPDGAGPRLDGAGSRLDGAGPRLRVLTANLLNGTADPDALVTQVKVDDVDVLAVQEFTPDALEALDAAGIGALLPYRAVNPVPRCQGSGVFSRHPLGPVEVRVHRCGHTQAAATLTLPGQTLVVESAHPCAPFRGKTGCWEQNLTNQPAAAADGPVRVLLGDFNATLDHTALRRLIATGYRDAAAERGKGLLPTWPFRDMIAPWITIDHVFVDRRVTVTTCATRRLAGSDHRGLLAELVLPFGDRG